MMTVPNTNDGSTNPPRLRLDITTSNVFNLPAHSTAPRGDDRTVLAAVKAAGFEGVQTLKHVAEARDVGLRVTGSGRINLPEDADPTIAKAADSGFDCFTVHVGWGTEDDAEIDRLVEATLAASHRWRIPVYIETHRATITQDMWRAVQITRRFPDIRFNGDFSHLYTGQEMAYGDINAKFDFLQPIFDRVRFVHGRIGNPGSIQVHIGDGGGPASVDHFREMWTRSFAGFLRSAGPGDYICFTPELIGPEIYYARTFSNTSGELVEESDRWQQALLYCDIARECFSAATARVNSGTPQT